MLDYSRAVGSQQSCLVPCQSANPVKIKSCIKYTNCNIQNEYCYVHLSKSMHSPNASDC